MKFFRLRVFRRMIFSVLAVVMAFYIMGLIINDFSRRTLSQEIVRSLEGRSHFFATQLDLQAQSLIAAQIEMGNDSQALDFHILRDRLSAYQHTKAIRDVSEKLGSIKRLHEIVRDLAVYYPSTGIRISASTPIYEAGQSIQLPQENRGFVRFDGGNLFLITQYPYIRRVPGSAPAFYVQSEITASLVAAQLSKMLTDKEGELFLLDREGRVWAGTAKAPPPALAHVQQALKAQPGQAEITSTRNGFAAYSDVPSLQLGIVYCLPEAAVVVPLTPYVYLNAALTALMIALLLVYSGYIRRAFMRPIALLMQRMREAPDEGDAALRNVPKDEFAAIYQQYDEMIKRNDRLIHENYQAVYRTRIAELRQLQYQIRPHFLYNSLFLLYRMAQSAHCEDIADYASHLGSYYQYITRFADHEVSVEQEIEHIQNYVNIQKLRFGDRIAAQMSELPGEARGMSIAALVLQPLVENAYEHGLQNKLADGRLRILMRWEEGNLLFSVEDNGAGMDEEAIAQLLAEIERADILEEARGLANTNLRLVMRYGPESRLHLLNLPGGGFRASVRIPRSDGTHVQPLDRG